DDTFLARNLFGERHLCRTWRFGASLSERSPPAFLGACRSRNARQMDPDFVQPGGGLIPFCRAMLSAKRFIAGVGERPSASPLTAAPSTGVPPAAAPSLSLPMIR